jgi:hypothetical protein
MRNILSLILLSVVLTGCKKEETLITGDITGYVTCISPFYKTYPLEGAAEVDLTRESLVMATQQTGEYGQFTFRDVPYGKFFLRPTKPGFVQAWMQEPVYHAGGATPTFSNSTLFEIPTFQLVYDSMVYSQNDYAQFMYMHFSDSNVSPDPFSSFSYFAFFSEQPTVDQITFATSMKISALIWDGNAYGDNDLIIGYLSYPGSTFSTLPKDLYVRLYAVASGQGYYPGEVLPGAYGPPSEVFAFKNPWAAR